MCSIFVAMHYVSVVNAARNTWKTAVSQVQYTVDKPLPAMVSPLLFEL